MSNQNEANNLNEEDQNFYDDNQDRRTNVVSRTDTRIIRATIQGTRDIMFDRFSGDIKTELEACQKMYLDPRDDETLAFPSINLMSAITAQNTDSFTKSLRDSRTYKKLCHSFAQFVSIDEQYIPFLRDGKPIKFGEFDGEEDNLSGMYIHHTVARLAKGIPNPKSRPVLPMDWSLQFDIKIKANKNYLEQDLRNILTEGLADIGLGTFRRTYGRADLIGWDLVRTE